jgi:hypothetical protein
MSEARDYTEEDRESKCFEDGIRAHRDSLGGGGRGCVQKSSFISLGLPAGTARSEQRICRAGIQGSFVGISHYH